MDDETVTLAYTEWTLVELDGEPLEIGSDEIQPTIMLDLEESRVSGSGGVNRLTLSESELRFGSLATTRMAGPESAMDREQSFLAALERVTSFELDGRALTLLAGDDAVARLSCTARA